MMEKINNLYHELPEKKKWIDLVTAVLTIPVLVTVIATNLGYIKKDEKQQVSAQTPQPTIERIIIKENGTSQPPSEKEETTAKSTETPSPTVSCDANLPNYEIVAPAENEKIKADPACITLRQTTSGNYCQPVWAYKTNNGGWSTFTNEPICLFNTAAGDVKIEVKLKSNNGSESVLSRNFVIVGDSQSTPAPIISATPEPTE